MYDLQHKKLIGLNLAFQNYLRTKILYYSIVKKYHWVLLTTVPFFRKTVGRSFRFLSTLKTCLYSSNNVT